ncbi:helix-turn-helix transcriptional regulator [Rhodophyticola sp. CCM32]|uniref:helix-turn-helix transcriptional regulator n=1 Tax=Rhodophyticola sp. CCM32 TaxID=2916397 RepID=UPI00143D339A|nr:autoinducer binding domain-containing protein [Rhodophyticola sp. CCM32]
MNEGLQAFATDLSRLTSVEAVWSSMSAHAEEHGFPFCTITMARRDAGLHSSRFMSNAPGEFRENYCTGGLIRDDPFLTLICRNMAAAAVITDPGRFPGIDGRQADFLEVTRALGVTHAICVPVSTSAQAEFGGWVIGGTEDEASFKRYYDIAGAELQLAGLLAFERISAITHLKHEAGACLSPRERECLLWLSAGLRVAMIATRLGISESAVTLYILNARRKLGAKTREQAVARAILSGEIQP